jgi:hypothetical protein
MRPVDGEVTGVVAVEMDDDEGVLRAWILLALHDGALNWLIGPRALLTVTTLLIVRARGYRSFSLLYTRRGTRSRGGPNRNGGDETDVCLLVLFAWSPRNTVRAP